MKVLVCGGRDYHDYARMKQELCADRWTRPITCIIEGGARGADSLARLFADENGIQVMEFPALWHIHGRRAGPLRNQQMLDQGKPEVVVAFPGGRGTADMVRRAKLAKIPVVEVKP
jgi:predicted Rossmann-fold nucleotide-binding protein